MERHKLNNRWDEEILKWQMAEEQSHNLAQEVRGIKRKVDIMNYVYTTFMERVQDKVWSYPDELGQFRHSITRARVIAITEEERVSTMVSGLV